MENPRKTDNIDVMLLIDFHPFVYKALAAIGLVAPLGFCSPGAVISRSTSRWQRARFHADRNSFGIALDRTKPASIGRARGG